MKKKKGFIFIETLIVLAVLTVSLLATYTAYNSSIIKETIRLRYDDTAYMYRTFYISQFLRDFNLEIAKESLNVSSNIYSIDCKSDILFYGREANKVLCDNLKNQLNISNIYITLNDLSDLQNCTDFTGKCEVLGQINEDAANYIKTIGGYETDGYRIIIEYEECKDGTRSSCNNQYLHYYATLSLGDIE